MSAGRSSIEGKASVRLLPTPVLSFTDIRIGDREAPELQMERFRAEVELAPLLKGEVRIIHMALERPRFRVDIAGLARRARGALDRAWKIDPERVSLARLEVVEGTAIIDDSRSGTSWQANDIDALIEAGSLRGPGKVEANLILEGRPIGRAHRARPLRRRRHRRDESLRDHAALSADAFDRRHAHPRQERAAVLRGRRHAWRALRRPKGSRARPGPISGRRAISS